MLLCPEYSTPSDPLKRLTTVCLISGRNPFLYSGRGTSSHATWSFGMFMNEKLHPDPEGISRLQTPKSIYMYLNYILFNTSVDIQTTTQRYADSKPPRGPGEPKKRPLRHHGRDYLRWA